MSGGMARKNEKSVAPCRDKPSSMPPMMVAPLRLVPGTMARHCTKPTLRASGAVIASSVWMRGGGGARGLGEENDQAPDDEGAGPHHRCEQMGLDGLAEQQAQKHGGKKADGQVERQALRLALAGQGGQRGADLGPVHQDHRQDGAGLDRDIENLGLGIIEAQQRPRQNRVPGGRYRQEFGQPLDGPHDGGLDQQYNVPPGSLDSCKWRPDYPPRPPCEVLCAGSADP